MSQESINNLLARFVNIYSEVSDTGLDLFLNPKLWFMPLNNSNAKREAAKYFLLAASLSDSKLTGNPRNIRILLDHLYSALGAKLYAIKNPAELTYEVSKCEHELKNLDRLGPQKSEIAEVLASANRFIDKARGDLPAYCSALVRKGAKPEWVANELSANVKRMNGYHKSKAWLYLRWMTRKHPDLDVFDFNPKDLSVPLNTPKLRVAVAAGLLDDYANLPFALTYKNRSALLWDSQEKFDQAQKRLTAYAQILFPDDPAKVDFPFFILGMWLEDADLTMASL